MFDKIYNTSIYVFDGFDWRCKKYDKNEFIKYAKKGQTEARNENGDFNIHFGNLKNVK